ncbi:MaoC/PaaZ C-terminal domain-containing protein [Streptomyces sp. NPDC048639]|uniref:MaoC/PaaZ C-terminal domain-containing protein n=1 Tax=Streptomyces sp. NPDC048639 TaxID=3365581 RepID=UPI003722BDB5
MPRLVPALGAGVLTGIGKRPRPEAALPRFRLVVPGVRPDRQRLTAYSEVCGFPPGHRPLPLTYPHVLGFPLAARLMAARAFPLPLPGLVHTSIEITQWAPLSPDDSVDLSVHAEELKAHRRGTEAVIVTEAWRDGVRVWRDLSTYLARGPATPTDRTAGTDSAPARDRAAGVADGPLTARATWRLPPGLGRRHAAVSGDYNPIHLHPWTARPLGFRRAIAHGMWTFARCVAESDAAAAEEVTVRAEFRSPVLLPSSVTYAADGPAFELRSGDGGERLHLRGEVTAPPARR